MRARVSPVRALSSVTAREVAWHARLLGAAMVALVVHEVWAGYPRVHAGELFPWRHLPVVPLASPAVATAEWAALAVLGACVALQVAPRVTLRLAALVALWGIGQRYTNQRALLVIVLSFLALDPPGPDPGSRAWPNVALVRLQLVLVYVTAAVAKILEGFLSGDSLAVLLGMAPGPARAASIAVVAAELALPILLVLAPRAGALGVALLHAGFSLFMPGLLPFGLTMIAMAALSWDRALVRNARGEGAGLGLPASTFSAPVASRRSVMRTKGTRDKRSERGPSKNGLDAFAQLVSLLSTSPITPARNAMTMPAIAPPAM